MKENTPNYPDLSVSRDSLLRLIHITDNENTSLIYFTKCLIYAKFHLFNTSVLLRGGGKWSMIKHINQKATTLPGNTKLSQLDIEFVLK